MRAFYFSLSLIVLLLLAGKPEIRAQEPAPAVQPGAPSTVAALEAVHNKRAETIPPVAQPHALYLPAIAFERDLFYVNGQTGDDSSNGTAERPWRSLDHAVASIKAGSTVIIGGGIYRVPSLRFGPAGQGPEKLTRFVAAPDARVLITRPDGTPPTIEVSDYVRLENLWFGGVWKAENSGGFFTGGSPQGYGKQLINCTLFGYAGGISHGSAEYNVYQGNRFVLNGDGRFLHPIYLSGGYTAGSMAQHAIVDDNIFIGGEGYAIHGWHNARSNIITRNVVVGHYWGLVMDGSDHLIANNFFWKPTGQQGREGPWGAWLPGANIITVNNVFAHATGIVALGPNATVYNNAFLNSPSVGEAAVVLTPGQEADQIGISAEEFDAAVATLKESFARSVEEIYEDDGIEAAFATLRLPVPAASPLAREGDAWFAPGDATDIGPRVAAPESVDAFWQSFRALGLRDFDRYGNVVAP